MGMKQTMTSQDNDKNQREYIKIWGVPNEKNLSAPVLTKPTDANKEFKYNEKPY